MTIPLCQIALSVTDLGRTHAWYRRVFGLLPAAERRHNEGPAWARVPGLPEASFDVWWLVGAQRWMQFEMFEFQAPAMKPLRPDHRRSDIGYASIGIRVAELDAILERLRTEATHVSPTIGAPGRRRVALRDPEGIWLELMEDDVRGAEAEPLARPAVGAYVQSVSLSVPDLAKAARFWRDTLGLAPASATLHDAEHEALWGLAGARPQVLLLRSADVLVELLSYPDARPRHPEHLISDQGILNVALGTTDREAFFATYDRVVEAGYRANTEPFHAPGAATVVYVNDDQGFSVELLHVESAARMGFEPREG